MSAHSSEMTLLTSDAGSFITDQVLIVDVGRTTLRGGSPMCSSRAPIRSRVGPG